MEESQEKVIIVEGLADKKRVNKIVSEPVTIICTNGTIGLSKMDELVEMLSEKDVYLLLDADKAGEKLRKLFKKEFPEAKHLYIDRGYRAVETTPYQQLAAVLLSANIDVHVQYLNP